MISPKTVCFVYFALVFGVMHAETTNRTEVNVLNTTKGDDKNQTSTISNNDVPSSPHQTSGIKQTSLNPTSPSLFCSPTPPQHTKGECILSLPIEDPLHLIVVALTVCCLAFLITTLMCACQVCHLRGIISSLQSQHGNIDLHAVRERSESPRRNEYQVDGHPTETCLMLSEVSTGKEESKVNEEMNETEQITTIMDPNGDANQESSHEPDVNQEPDNKPLETINTGV